MAADLHTHTTFSDGRRSPRELLAEAREAGLDYLAITDHDTVEALRFMKREGLFPAEEIEIIPGIEFSVSHPKHTIHLLGYYIDIENTQLLERIIKLAEARNSRAEKIIKRLQELGYDLTEDDVREAAEGSESIGRPHVARALLRKGYFRTLPEIFGELLGKGRPAYILYERIALKEAISLIKDAGGVPVLAHPKLVGNPFLVEDICRSGIEGIEVFYPRHDAEDIRYYQNLAEKYGLLSTGGSDYHASPPREPRNLGEFVIDNSYVEKLRERAGR